MQPILCLIRPSQWVKNLFIFLPVFFDQRLTDAGKVLPCVIAFLGFSLVASSIYCLNDLADAESDRKHPEKQERPLASGALSPLTAKIMAGLLLLAGFAVLFIGRLAWEVIALTIFYYLMNIAYTFKLKHIAIIDVFVIALGFVIRILIGGFAAQVLLSHWIVILTFLLALFLGFAKRRDDAAIYEQQGIEARNTVVQYNSEFLNAVMMISATITIIAYIMYSIDSEVVGRLGSDKVYCTSIFVIAGIFRYLQLTLVQRKSGNPAKVLLKDRFIQLCVIGWVGMFVFFIYFK